MLETTLIGLILLTGLPAVLFCTYLGIASLLSGALKRPGRAGREMRFDVIVPAHDEAPVIARCISSLRQLSWPEDRLRVTVIADNCKDATAAIALQLGARVLQRQDDSRRGKGYALQLAFETSLREGWADAVVVVDADSEASCNLLEAFAAGIASGAHAIQAHYGVLNAWVSWRTRLMSIAQEAFHRVRSRARERLGVSCGIRGNGWCVTRQLLQRVPYRAFCLAEDVEYGIELGLAGYRVHYADEASVHGEMVSSAQVAVRQRQRWEGGRSALRRSRTGPLLLAAIRRGSPVCLDLALDLLVPPLSQIALMVAAFTLAAGLGWWWDPRLKPAFWIALAAGGVLWLYVLRGWQLSATGLRGLMDLARAPGFVLWKLIVVARHREPQEWIRTQREQP